MITKLVGQITNGEELARRFHDTYERLAPAFGYETRPDTKAFDAESPNGRLMIAVCTVVGNQIQNDGFTAGFETGLREKTR